MPPKQREVVIPCLISLLKTNPSRPWRGESTIMELQFQKILVSRCLELKTEGTEQAWSLLDCRQLIQAKLALEAAPSSLELLHLPVRRSLELLHLPVRRSLELLHLPVRRSLELLHLPPWSWTASSISPNFEETQHCIHVVTTSQLQSLLELLHPSSSSCTKIQAKLPLRLPECEGEGTRSSPFWCGGVGEGGGGGG